MNAIVIEHVKVGDLPEEWRTRIAADTEARVTVRIEEETSQTATTPMPEREDDTLFGMWHDRAEMADVGASTIPMRREETRRPHATGKAKSSRRSEATASHCRAGRPP